MLFDNVYKVFHVEVVTTIMTLMFNVHDGSLCYNLNVDTFEHVYQLLLNNHHIIVDCLLGFKRRDNVHQGIPLIVMKTDVDTL